MGKVEKEFFTRTMIQTPRQCHALACCSADTNLIAAGYEKTTLKNESTLLVWDITRAINPNSNRVARGIEATFMDEDSAIAKVEP
jgi:hypothetical protein